VIGSIFKLATQRPDLLVDHLLAYTVLARREIAFVKRRAVRRILAAAISLAAGFSFVILAGMSLMFSAAGSINTPWMLWAVPGTMLVVSIVAALIAMSDHAPELTDSVGLQIQRDLKLFRDLAGAPRE
jgi:protein-S-isoprenylcysteine O-methyltransferase Ste14